MAADAKKVTIDLKAEINPFGECKGKKAPEWVAAVDPNLAKKNLVIARKMEVDGRKWKPKDLENGAYAIARYDLKIFSVALGTLDKKLNAMLPPVKGKRNWAEVKKSKAPKDKEAWKLAGTVTGVWTKIAKEIENKVSVALDEVEADTGDNKKALSSAKEAIKKFTAADPGKVLNVPIVEMTEALKKYSAALKKTAPGEKEKGKKEVEKTVAGIEGTFNANSKKVYEVVKYFHDSGKTMAKDEKANIVFQNLGKFIVDNMASLKNLEKDLAELEKQMTAVKNLVKKDEVRDGEISSITSALDGLKSKQARSYGAAKKTILDIEKKFKAAKTEVKA